MRFYDRLRWLTFAASLGLAHCATAVQDEADRDPSPTAGLGGATGGAKAQGGKAPTGGTRAGTGGSSGAVGGRASGGRNTGGARATGGAKSSGGARAFGGSTSTFGGSTSTFGGSSPVTGGKSGQGGGTQLGGETGDAGEASLPSTGGVMTGTGGATQAGPCADGTRNGSETDVDCGGSCDPCTGGKACNVGSDCAGALCNAHVCAPDFCGDDHFSGNESDVDCGGSCALCTVGRTCHTGADCEAGTCDGGICTLPESCVYDWRSDSCGQTCLARTQSDQRACERVLDCFVENDCGPSTCTGNTEVCGNNAIQQGAAPYPYAATVYNCMCQ